MKVLVCYSPGKRYHTNDECDHLTEKYREWDKELAESWGLEECAYCQEKGFQTGGDKQLYQAALNHDA